MDHFISDLGGLVTTEIYDPSTNTWSEGPDMPHNGLNVKLVEVGGRLVLLGGESNGFRHVAVYVLRGDLSGWDVHPGGDLSEGFSFGAAVAVYNAEDLD